MIRPERWAAPRLVLQNGRSSERGEQARIEKCRDNGDRIVLDREQLLEDALERLSTGPADRIQRDTSASVAA
jgi:hypothetical protein